MLLVPLKGYPCVFWSEISEIGSHLSKHKFGGWINDVLCAHDISIHTYNICVYKGTILICLIALIITIIMVTITILILFIVIII